MFVMHSVGFSPTLCWGLHTLKHRITRVILDICVEVHIILWTKYVHLTTKRTNIYIHKCFILQGYI
jgi:hypothetical protein